jgi:hypothetical protein
LCRNRLARAFNEILTEATEDFVKIRSRELYDDRPLGVLSLIARDFNNARWRKIEWCVGGDKEQDPFAMVVYPGVELKRVRCVDAAE